MFESCGFHYLLFPAQAAFSIAQQQKNMVGKACRQIDVVQNHKYRAVGFSAMRYQGFQYLQSMVQVEVIGGFVE